MRQLLQKHDLAVDMLRMVNDLLQHKGLTRRSRNAVDATTFLSLHKVNEVVPLKA